MSSTSVVQAWLIALPSGMPLDPLELNLTGRRGGLIIGRNKDCDLPLPATAENVSRRHAELAYQNGRWHIADLGSRWGTYVNGVRLGVNRLVALSEGDLVRIQPWTFRFSRDRTSTSGSVAVDDKEKTHVRTLLGTPKEPLRQDMLSLLLEGASTIQGAANESELMQEILRLARLGTGLENATVLRALDADGRVEAMTGNFGEGDVQQSGMQFSRSLLAAASQGAVAEFCSASDVNPSMSIVQANITTALCAPLMLGATVAAYLYLDSRGGAHRQGRPHPPNAAGFCQALCRIGGLALANLKRIDIERRAARLEAELGAASAAQRWIFPREPVTAAPFVCVGKTQPGGFLGGDFFDAMVLSDGRLAVALGDVSGHSAAASVLMTAAQGFLHSSLMAHGDLVRAVNSLNAFVKPRCSAETFVTLWAGVFDPRDMSLQYVDAGHGYAMLLKNDRSVQALDENGGVPIGIDAEFKYESATADLGSGSRVLVFSDGIAEQTSDEVSADGQRREFGKDAVQQLIAECEAGDVLDNLFEALAKFAGGKSFTDDVTGVLVHWPAGDSSQADDRLRGTADE
jgi:hypothetical protein